MSDTSHESFSSSSGEKYKELDSTEYTKFLERISTKVEQYLPLSEEEVVQLLQLHPENAQSQNLKATMAEDLATQVVQTSLVTRAVQKLYQDSTLRPEINNFIESHLNVSRQLVVRLLSPQNAGYRGEVAKLIVEHRPEFADYLVRLADAVSGRAESEDTDKLQDLDLADAEKLLSSFNTGDTSVRQSLALVIGGSPQRFQTCLARLLQDADPAVRICLAYGIEEPAESADLITLLLQDPDEKVQLTALAQIELDPEPFQERIGVVFKTEFPAVEQRAIEMMVENYPVFQWVLREPELYAFSNRPGGLKLQIINRISDEPQKYKLLLYFFSKDESSATRAQALLAMAKEPRFFKNEIRAFSRDPAPGIRNIAVDMIAEHPDIF